MSSEFLAEKAFNRMFPVIWFFVNWIPTVLQKSASVKTIFSSKLIFLCTNLFSVSFDGFKECLNVGMDVDNFISEEGNDPAGRKGQDPQLVGSLKQKNYKKISKSFKNKTGLQSNRKK